MTMKTYANSLCLIWLTANLLSCIPAGAEEHSSLTLHTRRREPIAGSTNEWKVTEKPVQWDPKQTALIICDMWDKHWCQDATERVGEMAPG